MGHSRVQLAKCHLRNTLFFKGLRLLFWSPAASTHRGVVPHGTAPLFLSSLNRQPHFALFAPCILLFIAEYPPRLLNKILLTPPYPSPQSSASASRARTLLVQVHQWKD